MQLYPVGAAFPPPRVKPEPPFQFPIPQCSLPRATWQPNGLASSEIAVEVNTLPVPSSSLPLLVCLCRIFAPADWGGGGFRTKCANALDTGLGGGGDAMHSPPMHCVISFVAFPVVPLAHLR